MSTQQTPPQVDGSTVNQFATHLRYMPTWHKRLLMVSIITVAGGLIGQASTYLRTTPPPEQQQPVATAEPGTESAPAAGPGLHFFGAPPPKAQPTAAATPATQPADEPMFSIDHISPKMTKVGLTFIGGFIVGWIFRAFIKTMTIVAALGFGAITLMSYFNVLNIDMTAAKQKYETSMAWVTDQAGKAKDAVLNQLGGSTSGLVGAFLGFRRR